MKRAKSKKNYDAEMIEDFFEHYIWALRHKHFEQSSRGHHPELVDQLVKHWSRYGKVGFSRFTLVDSEKGLSWEDHHRAEYLLRRRIRLELETALEAIERAQPHIRRALEVLREYQKANRLRRHPPTEYVSPWELLLEEMISDDDLLDDDDDDQDDDDGLVGSGGELR